MGRRGWRIAIAVGCACTIALVGWTWFLSGKSLDVMDQSSSVLSSFLAIIALFCTIFAIVQDARSSPSRGKERSYGARTFTAGDVTDSNITMGDNSPINRREDG